VRVQYQVLAADQLFCPCDATLVTCRRDPRRCELMTSQAAGGIVSIPAGR